jgi:hypothetical protein
MHLNIIIILHYIIIVYCIVCDVKIIFFQYFFLTFLLLHRLHIGNVMWKSIALPHRHVYRELPDMPMLMSYIETMYSRLIPIVLSPYTAYLVYGDFLSGLGKYVGFGLVKIKRDKGGFV